MYLFTWETPVFDGKLKSCHALELPFMWDAIDKPGLSMLTGDGPERQALADAMHAAWIAFARTGDPGWPAYDLDRRATQRFDTTVEIVDDPMGDAARPLWRPSIALTHPGTPSAGRALLDDGAAVDREGVADHVAGGVGAEPDDARARSPRAWPSRPIGAPRCHRPLDLLVAAHEALEHRRARAARAHAVDPDPGGAHSMRGRLREPDDAVLARDVRRQPGEADEPRPGRDVHDRAAPRPAPSPRSRPAGRRRRRRGSPPSCARQASRG